MDARRPPNRLRFIFAITSANWENSRYNPIPFHIRAIGVDRLARDLQPQMQFRYRVLGIPHCGHTKTFAQATLKEIQRQTEEAERSAGIFPIPTCSASTYQPNSPGGLPSGSALANSEALMSTSSTAVCSTASSNPIWPRSSANSVRREWA